MMAKGRQRINMSTTQPDSAMLPQRLKFYPLLFQTFQFWTQTSKGVGISVRWRSKAVFNFVPVFAETSPP